MFEFMFRVRTPHPSAVSLDSVPLLLFTLVNGPADVFVRGYLFIFSHLADSIGIFMKCIFASMCPRSRSKASVRVCTCVFAFPLSDDGIARPGAQPSAFIHT